MPIVKKYNRLTIFCDGGARGNPGLAAAGVVAVDDRGMNVVKIGKFLGMTTNNCAEYQAVLLALNWLITQSFNTRNILFKLDSLLVVKQLMGEYKIRDSKLKDFFLKIKMLEKKFPNKIIYTYIPRTENGEADAVVNHTLDKHSAPCGTLDSEES